MIRYNKNLKSLARILRTQSTLGEILLWDKALKQRKMFGYQFNRQMGLSIENKNVIVDFICRKLKIIIEVDGYSHQFKFEDDSNRDGILRKEGYIVLRFKESEIRHNINETIRIIENIIKEREKSPCPL